MKRWLRKYLHKANPKVDLVSMKLYPFLICAIAVIRYLTFLIYELYFSISE